MILQKYNTLVVIKQYDYSFVDKLNSPVKLWENLKQIATKVFLQL